MTKSPQPRLVEIRAYKLKPASLAAFHATVLERAVPLLRDWGTEVVSFGPSEHEADCYYLVRAYDDLPDLQRRQAEFYGSDAWRSGPREAVVGLIESYLNTVLWLSPASIEDLQRSNARP